MNELNRFDGIAPYYESLKRLVFGKAIHEAEIYCVPFIKAGAKVLIVGGGSGEMLRVLLNAVPDCRVWYVEASARMIKLATKTVGVHGSRVIFVHGTQPSMPVGFEFDVVVTNFFLDLFPEEKIARICNANNKLLCPEGMWIITDFVEGRKWWQGFLLWVMYRFFRVACAIDARRLPDWEQTVKDNGFYKKLEGMFYSAFIKASLWIKGPT